MPAFEARLRQMSRILGGFKQMFLLNSELPILPIGHQRVRDVPECALNGLLVGQNQYRNRCRLRLH